MSLKRDDLAKALKGPACLIYAEDTFLLKEAVSELKAHILAEPGADFNFSAFDIESPDAVPPIEHIIDILNTLAFMGGRKTVIIEGVHKMKADAQKSLSAYLKKPSPEAALIMTHILKYERAMERKTKLEKINKTFDGARIIEIKLREAEYPGWVAARAKARGVTIAPAEASLLVELIGHDLGLLASEVEKFSLLGNTTVTREDIMRMVRGSGDYDAFDLTRAMDDKNKALAMKICRHLTTTQEPIMVLGALNYHYGKHGWTSQGKKRKVYALLNEADRLLRSSSGAYPLELLIVKLLSA